jgi:hypothetical protein
MQYVDISMKSNKIGMEMEMNTTRELKEIEHEIKEYKNEYESKQYAHLSTGLGSIFTITMISLLLSGITVWNTVETSKQKPKNLSKSIDEIGKK